MLFQSHFGSVVQDDPEDTRGVLGVPWSPDNGSDHPTQMSCVRRGLQDQAGGCQPSDLQARGPRGETETKEVELRGDQQGHVYCEMCGSKCVLVMSGGVYI